MMILTINPVAKFALSIGGSYAMTFCQKDNVTQQQPTVESIRKQLADRSEVEIADEVYEVREIYDVSSWEERTNQLKLKDWTFLIGEVIFAEDSNGNFLTINSSGQIHFLDHETDERTYLAETLDEFQTNLQKPSEVDLPPHKVISAWIDPDFKAEFD